MSREVVCVDIDTSSSYYGDGDCRCIKQIGYVITGDTLFQRSPAEVHDKIEDGEDFYVEHNGEKTDLIPAERGGTKYVRTEPNRTDSDNLLEQDSC